MGKRRVGFKTKKDGVDRLKNVADSDEELGGRSHGAPEKDLDSYLDDEIDKYNAEREATVRSGGKKKRNKGPAIDSDDEEQEIYGLDVSSDENDEDEDEEGMEDSSEEGDKGKIHDDGEEDSEEEEDDDNDEDILKDGRDIEGRIPDSRAWGKRARAFHSTDYVDQDFGGFEGADAELAQQEEDEAKEIQKRLTAELDEADFMDFLPTPSTTKATTESAAADKLTGRKSKEILKLDLDGLSAAEKRKLVERECPAVIHLLDEYKEKLNMAIATKKAVKDGEKMDIADELDPETKLYHQYLMTKYLCLLNYCINISYFLYLRSTNPTSCKGHPVMKVILQYRRLLDELNTFKSSKIRQQAPAVEEDDLPIPTKELKTKIISKKNPLPFEFDDDDDDDDSSEEDDEDIEMTAEELGLMNAIKGSVNATEAEMNENEKADGQQDEEHEKRAITREMAKNKGLTPKRKKEQRNPRVKHREKYRKAKIRRRGQVRTARTEVTKYDGEASGIKSHITKSIKIK